MISLRLKRFEDPDVGLASWLKFINAKNSDCLHRFWNCPISPDLPHWGHWRFLSLIHPYSEFLLSILILKVQQTSISFKSWLGALQDAGGSWLEFGILILVLIWILVFYSPRFKILDIWRCKELVCPFSPDWGSWGHWRFLTKVWHLNLSVDMVTDLW